jgi:hypothetical protein
MTKGKSPTGKLDLTGADEMVESQAHNAVYGITTEDVARHMDSGSVAIAAILGQKVLTVADLNYLRREVFANGSVSQSDAEGLFAIERMGLSDLAEWTEFFVEAITDYTVWQMRPTGVVSETQGEWLLEQVDLAKTMGSLAALCNILAEADRVPAWLPAAARGRLAAGWKGVDAAIDAVRDEQLAA